MKRTLIIWFAALLLSVIAIVASVVCIDEPLALLNYKLFGQWRPTVAFVQAPSLSLPLVAAVIFVALGLRSLCGTRLSKIETVVLLCGVNVMVADAIKGQLKFVFGRAWPISWKAGTVSFVDDGVRGFHFFSSGYESFPSGHAAAVAAIVAVVWIFYPKARAIAATAFAVVAIALVILDYHFLSDVIAGAFLGVSVAIFTIALWRATAVTASSLN